MGPLHSTIICFIGLVLLLDHAAATTDIRDAILHRTKKARFLGRQGVIKGATVAKRLIGDALRLPNSEQGFKQYLKHGDFNQAMIDFNTARIMNVKRYSKPNGEYGLVGTAGNRRFHLNNGGISGRPTIEIRKIKIRENSSLSERKGVISEKITYEPFID